MKVTTDKRQQDFMTLIREQFNKIIGNLLGSISRREPLVLTEKQELKSHRSLFTTVTYGIDPTIVHPQGLYPIQPIYKRDV